MSTIGKNAKVLPFAGQPALGSSDADFRLLCDLLPQALLVLDDAGAIRYANAAAESLMNAGFSAMEGKMLADFLELNDEWQWLLTQVPASQRSVTGHDLAFHLTRSGSEARKVTLHVMALSSGFGAKTPRALLLEAEAASSKLGSHASQQKSMQSAAIMSHILAHEVRNPLSGIRGAAQLMQPGADEENRPLLDLICSEVDRIGGLLNQMEYFAAAKPVAMDGVNIHEVLRYVRDVAQKGVAAGITIREEYDPSLPPVRGNREMLIQAVLNLVKNAAEALQGTKEPVITLKTSYRGGFRMTSATGEAVALPICVQVRDNGPGIAESFRGQIFDPFVTDKSGGKGLGLSIVAKILADHGGVLVLEDAAPGNTQFAMQLAAWQETEK